MNTINKYVIGMPAIPEPLGGVFFTCHKTASKHQAANHKGAIVMSAGWVRRRNPSALKGLVEIPSLPVPPRKKKEKKL